MVLNNDLSHVLNKELNFLLEYTSLAIKRKVIKKKGFSLISIRKRKYMRLLDDDEMEIFRSYHENDNKEMFLSNLDRRFERRGAICATNPMDSRILKKTVQKLITFVYLREMSLI